MEMPKPKERAVLEFLDGREPTHTHVILDEIEFPISRTTLHHLLNDLENQKLTTSRRDDNWAGTGYRRIWHLTHKGKRMVKACKAFERAWLKGS
jgi:DNA-binding HxlR family transcriptional regulator